MNARIGDDSRVHLVEEEIVLSGGQWAVSQCGWSGMAELTNDETTCRSCKTRPRYRNGKRKFND